MRAAVLFALALAACISEKPALPPDADVQPMPDAMPDTPTEDTTLTSYVIDLITTQTTATASPRPYSEFATLPDPDAAANNTSAYNVLFP